MGKSKPATDVYKMSKMTDFANAILAADDKPLFEEACRCADAGANRAAYVMIWLSCAESFKRRFADAGKRDHVANKVNGEISKRESEHKAVDKYLLDKAKEYGFVNDTAHHQLEHIYEMRCIYGHPYEKEPTDEQVIHAASIVVNELLQHPLRFKHGFAEVLLHDLLNKKTFLDDHEEAVNEFAKEVVPRIDSSIYGWFFDRYVSELDAIITDCSLQLFVRRGIWFCQQLLLSSSTAILGADEWHQRASNHPKVLLIISDRGDLFGDIGELAKATLFNEALTLANSFPRALRVIAGLAAEGVLNADQLQRLAEFFEGLVTSADGAGLVKASEVEIRNCVNPIVAGLKKRNWYIQSPLIELLVGRGPSGLEGISDKELIILGRNVYQTADGGEKKACSFLWSDSLHKWPEPFVKGMLLEGFVDDEGKFRFKLGRLQPLVNSIDKCNTEARDRICGDAIELIRIAELKNAWVGSEEFDDADDKLSRFDWTGELAEVIRNKRALLPKDSGA